MTTSLQLLHQPPQASWRCSVVLRQMQYHHINIHFQRNETSTKKRSKKTQQKEKSFFSHQSNFFFVRKRHFCSEAGNQNQQMTSLVHEDGQMHQCTVGKNTSKRLVIGLAGSCTLGSRDPEIQGLNQQKINFKFQSYECHILK